MRFYTHIAGGILLFTLLVWLFNLPFSIAGILFTGWISVLPDLVDRVVGEHRGWGHSVIWLIPICASFLVNITFGIAFISGFMMHILFDIVTRKGVPFLYPFSSTRLVMPKKEKSRIITGSKQEIALFIVVLLLLIPVSYGVVHGYDLGSALSGNSGNNTLNKTNKTSGGLLGNATKYATSNLRSNSSYPKSSSGSGYSSGSKNADSSSSNTNQNSSSDDQGLLDWLTNNQFTQDTSDDTNQNTTNNQNNTVSDALFDDMSSSFKYDNLQEGQAVEASFNMTDNDSSGFGFFDNAAAGDSSGDSSEDDFLDYENGGGDYFDFDLGYLLVPVLTALGGWGAVKL